MRTQSTTEQLEIEPYLISPMTLTVEPILTARLIDAAEAKLTFSVMDILVPTRIQDLIEKALARKAAPITEHPCFDFGYASCPTRTLPSTETVDPSLATERIEREDPNITFERMEAFEPARVKPRTERELAISNLPLTLEAKTEPNLECPVTLHVEPSLIIARIDNELPL
jgi:hypothetical protein